MIQSLGRFRGKNGGKWHPVQNHERIFCRYLLNENAPPPRGGKRGAKEEEKMVLTGGERMRIIYDNVSE